MKIKVKEVTREVPLLVDPEPGFMSLVNHGANQTPWNSLKSDRQQENSNMAKGKGAKRAGIITRINFSKEAFKTEKSVEDFLENNSITGCEVEDEGDIFVAKSTELDGYDLDKARSQQTKHAGVTMYVAEIKSDKKPEEETQDGEGEETDDAQQANNQPADKDDDNSANETDDADAGEEAQKGATKAKSIDGNAVKSAKSDDVAETTDTELRFPANKYDFWAAYMSNEGSLMGVLKDGIDYDGLPPGCDEIISAVFYSTGNVLSGSEDIAEKKAKLAQIGEDYAALTIGLFELFNQATEDSQKSANVERKAKAAAFVASFSESVTRAAKGEAPVLGDNVIKDAVTVDIADANTGDEDDDKLAKLIGKAMAPLLETIDSLNGEINDIKKSQKGVDEALSRSNARRNDASIIDSLAVDNDDEEDEDKEETVKHAEQDRIYRMFGRTAPKQNA